jgi:tetratricopeptide (TPR) repeat protein
MQKALTGLIFSIFILLSGNYLPVDPFEDKLENGIQAFYQTQWDSASVIFNELKQDKPDDPRAYFFSSMIPFWEYFFIDQSPESASAFLSTSELAINITEKKLESSPSDTTLVTMLSGLHGYRSLVAAGEKQYRIAIRSGMTGFSYTRRLLAINDDRPDAKIGRGMFYYMIGSVPRELRWMTNMFGLRGDIEMGLNEIKTAAESDSYVSTDAKMILTYLYKKEERYQEALEYISDLTNLFPENSIFHFNKAQILEELDNSSSAAISYATVIELNNPNLPNLTVKSREHLLRLNSDLSSDSTR